MKKPIMLVLTLISLQGCVGAFVAGAATGGLAVYDHREITEIKDDTALLLKIERALAKDKDFQDSHIVVSSYSKRILLAGQTPRASLRVKAEKIARAFKGVDRVYNEITISSPTAMMTRTGDTWITTKVKTEMLATKDLKSGSIKVITENGSVFLMGEVSKKQAGMAVNIARQVTGVQRVVKVFDYTKPTA